jgi:predicted ATPase
VCFVYVCGYISFFVCVVYFSIRGLYLNGNFGSANPSLLDTVYSSMCLPTYSVRSKFTDCEWPKNTLYKALNALHKDIWLVLQKEWCVCDLVT